MDEHASVFILRSFAKQNSTYGRPARSVYASIAKVKLLNAVIDPERISAANGANKFAAAANNKPEALKSADRRVCQAPLPSQRHGVKAR
jgi:hypothetical protein